MVAALATAAVRPRVAGARQPAGVRWPQRLHPRAVRAPRGAVAAAIYHAFNPQGLGIIAASLLCYGTEEQKQRWAVPILRAEITASLGMSEPGAGSDLAGLTTRAVLDGDHFVVNGQKVWTSGAHDADSCSPSCAPTPTRRSTRGSAHC